MSIRRTEIQKLKTGQYIMVEDQPCIIKSTERSKSGKHGHAKVRLEAVGLIDGKKRIIVMPGHDNVEVPIIEKKNAQVLSIAEDTANVMDSETYETFDLKIPEDLKGQVSEGMTVLYWEILDQKVMKQIKGE